MFKSVLQNVKIGAEGFTTEEDQELLNRIEKQVKRRFVIGSQVSEHALLQDFARQVSARLQGLSFQISSFLVISLQKTAYGFVCAKFSGDLFLG